MFKYMKSLINKIKEYELYAKKYNNLAKNPFIQDNCTNPFKQNKSLFFDRTYVWVEPACENYPDVSIF